MILQCERCQTRFRLEESRLPPTGARVRCSRCKHSFFAMPPGDVTRRGLANALAAEAAATGGVPVPGVTRDLDATLAQPIDSTAVTTSDVDPDADLPALSVPPHAPATSPRTADDENEWVFEQPEPTEVAPRTKAAPAKSSVGVLSEPLSEWFDAPSATPRGEAETKGLHAPDKTVHAPDATGLDGSHTTGLGDPDTTGLGASDTTGLDGPVAKEFASPSAKAAQGSPTPGDSSSRPLARALPSVEAPRAESSAHTIGAESAALDSLGSPDSWDFLASEDAPSPTPVAAPATRSARAANAVVASTSTSAAVASAAQVPTTDATPPVLVLAPRKVAGWGGVFAALCAIGALSILVPSPPSASSAAAVQAGPVAIDDLHGRFVEHAVEGPIFVVTGTLHGTAASARASGQQFVVRLGDSVSGAFGASPPESALREGAVSAMRAALDRSARALAAAPLADSDRIAVTAVIANAPRDLTGFVVEAQAVSGTAAASAASTAETSPASLPPSLE